MSRGQILPVCHEAVCHQSGHVGTKARGASTHSAPGGTCQSSGFSLSLFAFSKYYTMNTLRFVFMKKEIKPQMLFLKVKINYMES